MHKQYSMKMCFHLVCDCCKVCFILFFLLLCNYIFYRLFIESFMNLFILTTLSGIRMSSAACLHGYDI